MSFFATVTGYLKETFRGGTKTVSISKVSAGANNYSPLNCFSPGFEICPADGEHLVITKIENSESFMVTIGGINQNIEPVTNKGERRIFSVSSDGKTIKSDMRFTNDGKIKMIFGTTTIEFSSTGMKVTTPAGAVNFLTHIHQTGTGPSGAPTPNS